MTFRAGHIVACPNGHALYRMLEDSPALDPEHPGRPLHPLDYFPKASQVERIDELAAMPMAYNLIRPCPHCGKPWLGKLKREALAPDDLTVTEVPT